VISTIVVQAGLSCEPFGKRYRFDCDPERGTIPAIGTGTGSRLIAHHIMHERWRLVSRSWKVRPVDMSEFDSWSTLYRGYCDFYHQPTSDEHQLRIWSWIHDEKLVEALVAVEVDDSSREVGAPRGLAHVRETISPLRGVRCGYLDDLYVDPELRGGGAVDALFCEMNQMALDRAGRSSVDYCRQQLSGQRHLRQEGTSYHLDHV